MLKLLSISDDAWSLSRFGNDTDRIELFLEENGLHGLELMKWQAPRVNPIPKDRVIGRHLIFYPMWLDFWKSDKRALIRQFDTEENCFRYYNARSPLELVENYRRDLADSSDMGVEYVVFHVSHSVIEDAYAKNYCCSDGEVIDAFIEMINEILKGLRIGYTVLFENHWFPGLTLLNRGEAQRLLDGVHYPHKGFVLDIGHLMNTKARIRTEEEAVAYILDVLDGLGDLARDIRAIHLNSAATEEHVRESLRNARYNPDAGFETRLTAAMRHVGGMDPHKPFVHPGIQKIIGAVSPEYLVFELASGTYGELRSAVLKQNAALG